MFKSNAAARGPNHFVTQAYRADIEGLRALAVVPVILYHARLFCPGGFTGVDVFFVISGYLITRIIVSDLGKGAFKLGRFYERRVRRIFPALFVMLAVSSVCAYLFLLPHEMIAFGKSLMASAAFVSNVFFSGEIGYFDTAAEQKPLLHVWSLAVEEQFYIFWPLVLLVLHNKAGRKGAFFFCALLAGVSLLHSEYLVHEARGAAFYLMPSRAFELGIGALLSLGSDFAFLRQIPRRAADGASLAGIALICAALFLFDDLTPFPGKAALLPCLGAALIIASGISQRTLGGWLLSLPPFTFIGRISYSLYLWHWPMLVFAHLYLGRELHLDEKCWALLATALAAYLSWRFVEEPFRKLPVTGRSARAFIGGGAAAGFAFACAGAVIIAYEGFPRRIEADSGEIAKVREEHTAFAQSPCLVWLGPTPGAIPPVEGCLVGQPSTTANYNVVLWGDSHALQLAPVLDVLGKRLNFTGRVMSKAGCGPLPGAEFTNDKVTVKECPAFKEAAMQAVLHNGPSVIILASRWDAYATGAWLIAESSSARPSVAESLSTFVSILRHTILALTKAGHRVIVVGQVPVPIGDPIDCVERIKMTGRDASECAATSVSRAEMDSKVNSLLQQAAESIPGVGIVYPFDRLCNAQECPIFTADGRFIYMDGVHLSPTGAGLLSADIEAQITSLRRQSQVASSEAAHGFVEGLPTIETLMRN
jgi:peptidoglycan/LPS O-acetylase OafA/YrhL